MNYNFILPLADWFYGTYISPSSWEENEQKQQKEEEEEHKIVEFSEERVLGRQLWEIFRDVFYGPPTKDEKSNTYYKATDSK